QMQNVGAGDVGRTAEQEVLRLKIAPLADEPQDDRAEANGPGEEDADDSVAAQPAALAHPVDAQSHEDAENDHDGGDPVGKLRLVLNTRGQREKKAKRNAREGAVSEGIAE